MSYPRYGGVVGEAAHVALVPLEQSLAGQQPGVMWPLQPTPPSVAHGLTDVAGGSDSPRATVRAKGATRSRAGAQSATSGRPAPARRPARIGVISDNHGYLDPAVLEVFAGVTHIIHAGDIVDPDILDRLRAVAPVTAVAGNMDSGEPTSTLPREAVGEVAGVRFLVGHKRKRLLRELAAGRIGGISQGELPDLVIYGHDHVPAAAWVDGTLYLDPGSASAPHEEDDGPTVAIVEVRPTGLSVCFVPLKRRAAEEAAQRPRE